MSPLLSHLLFQGHSMEIILDKRGIVGFVEQDYDGKICPPNFQRDFVWIWEEVGGTVRAILRSYFLGDPF